MGAASHASAAVPESAGAPQSPSLLVAIASVDPLTREPVTAHEPLPLQQAPTAQVPSERRATEPAPAPPRANAETVVALAAEVARKLDARTTRFDLQLDPIGLGQVQVSLEIRSGGEVSAHLHFERPDTAADLRARSGELRTALESAGFSLGSAGLSFGDAGGRQPAPDQQAPRLVRAPVFVPVEELGAVPPTGRLPARAGVDVRI
jgi:flagellar hook-length control protein FliK